MEPVRQPAPRDRAMARHLMTPDRVETRIGTLTFSDGMPSRETLDAVYEHLDFVHAFDAFMNAFQGVNTHGLHRGFLEAGVADNEVLIFSELIDSRSLFLTANADTVYAGAFLDLTHGPVVLETPPGFLGALNDYWGGWVLDVGLPGGDRGQGGRYLVVPPGHEGPLPEGGFFVARPGTLHVLLFGRLFLQHDDPAPALELLRRTMKLYPYQPGGVGTSFASFLRGEAHLARIAPPPETTFHDRSGGAVNTVPPSDVTYFDWLDEVVQQEPAGSLDPELMGPIAALGIVKGRPFAPDERMRRILAEAAAVANATARSQFMRPRDPSWYWWPGSAWLPLTLTISGHDFMTPPPEVEGPVEHGLRTPTGVRTFPSTGYRRQDARIGFFYGVMCVSPAEAMRLSGVGSQYLVAMVDAGGAYLEGARSYRVTLPPDIPAASFWSLALYDTQTRSMLSTPQRWPRAGNQAYPSPAAEADANGTTTVWFAPEQPDGVARGNWIQTVPGQGWFVILRLYGPLESYFDRSWRLSEVIPVA
jgi:hypothetical protein